MRVHHVRNALSATTGPEQVTQYRASHSGSARQNDDSESRKQGPRTTGNLVAEEPETVKIVCKRCSDRTFWSSI